LFFAKPIPTPLSHAAGQGCLRMLPLPLGFPMTIGILLTLMLWACSTATRASETVAILGVLEEVSGFADQPV
jgi:hypothetical protein